MTLLPLSLRGLGLLRALLLVLGASAAFGQNVPGLRYDPKIVDGGDVSAMAELSDGRIIIGGAFTSVNGVPRQGLARLDPAGTLDLTWSPTVGGHVASLAVIGSDLYVGGEFQSIGGQTRQNLARISLSGDGSPDAWVVNTSSGYGQGRVVCMVTDGTNLYVGGDFGSIGNQNRAFAAKIAPASAASVDPGWNANIDSTIFGAVRAMRLSGNELFIGGYFSSPHQVMAKVRTSDGGDTGWNAGGFGGPTAVVVEEIALDGTGGVYAVGRFNSVGGMTRERAVKLSVATGAVDPAWDAKLAGGLAPTALLYAVTVDNGVVYLGGDFLSAGGLARGGFARTDTTTGAVDPLWAPVADKLGFSILAHGNTIYLGGIFREISGATALAVAKVDPNVGTRVPEYGAQVAGPGRVNAMARQPDGKLIIGGSFYLAEGLRRENIARLNVDGSVDRAWAPGANLPVHALAVYGPDIYVAGEFSVLGGAPRNFLGKLSTTGGDAADPVWNPNPDNVVDGLAADGTGVYVAGGAFNTIGGAARAHLARLSPSGAGAADAWRADIGGDGAGSLAISGGQLYVGGHFSSLGGVGRNSLGRVSTSTGAVDMGWAPGFPGVIYVNSLVVSGTDVFVGGQFSSISGYYRLNFGKISALGNGSADPAWEADSSSIDHTGAILGASNGNVYLAGNFSSINGQPHACLAKVSAATGAPDATWQKDADLAGSGGDIHAQVVTGLVEGDDVLAGGTFTSVNGFSRTGFVWLPALGAPVLTQDATTGAITIAPGPGDGLKATHFRIETITGGTLATSEGAPVDVGSFITVDDGAAGLVFTATSGAASISAKAALDPSANGVGPLAASLSVNQAGALPVIRFASATASVSEGQPVLLLTVVKSGAGAATVQFAAQSGSAMAFDGTSGDFLVLPGTLKFASSETSKTITALILQDSLVEGDETFTVTLSNPAGARLGALTTCTVSLIDDDIFGTPGSLLTVTPPDTALPPATGSLTIQLSPAGVGQWRPAGDFEWHNSGATVTALPAGNYPLEFRAVEGYASPDTLIAPVAAGALFSDATEYLALGAVAAGDLTVEILPQAVAGNANPDQRGQWRLQGSTAWQDGGAILAGLNAGRYVIEFKPVSGRVTPPIRTFDVIAGQLNGITAVYLVSEPVQGAPVAVLPLATATGADPYRFAGELQTEIGYASGCVVRTHAVLTVAHAIFNDDTLSFVPEMRWFFQRSHGAFDPAPEIARGAYRFDGYAAQRVQDASPGISTPASQELDTAVLFFLVPAGRGGSSGYLSSDEDQSEWLVSNRLKILMGYPVEDVNLADRGKLFATAPQNAAFTRLYHHVHATTGMRGFPGLSGGPLCVEDDSGQFFPAGIFLGGTQQSLVRAIDGQVVDLINRAETAGNSGGNSTGGGITYIQPGTTNDSSTFGAIQVRGPADTGGWRIHGESNFRALNGSKVSCSAGSYVVEFQAAPQFASPAPRTVRVQSAQTAIVDARYIPNVAPAITGASRQGTIGLPFSYAIAASGAPTSFTAKGLPPGLTLDAAGGVISGTPRQLGAFNVTVTATNAAGTSAPAALMITINLPASLTVTISGQGTVSAGFLGTTTREIGKSYTIIAKPNAGFIFAGWTGELTAQDRLLTFPMPVELTVQAAFIPNPFSPVAGAFAGLVADAPQTLAGSGLLALLLDPLGGFTGTLRLGADRRPLNGRFLPDGSFDGPIPRGHAPAILVHLQLVFGASPPKVTGTVVVDGLVLEIQAPHAIDAAPGNPAPEKGRFTLALPPDPSHAGDAAYPPGSGFGVATVGLTGAIRLAGTFGDGSPLMAGGAFAGDGTWAFYALPRARTGVLAGTIAFHAGAVDYLDGSLRWMMAAAPAAQRYPNAFDGLTAAEGSRYTAPVAGQRALDFPGSINLTLGLAAPITKVLTLGADNRFAIPTDGEKLKLTLSPTAGTLQGSFFDQVTGKTRPITGILLQKQNRAEGLFLEPQTTGDVTLSAGP